MLVTHLPSESPSISHSNQKKHNDPVHLLPAGLHTLLVSRAFVCYDCLCEGA